MYKVILRNEVAFNVIWVYGEDDIVIYEGLEIINEDSILQELDKEAGDLYSTFFDEGFHFDFEKEKKERPRMLAIVEKIKKRLNEINDGSFVVIDQVSNIPNISQNIASCVAHGSNEPVPHDKILKARCNDLSKIDSLPNESRHIKKGGHTALETMSKEQLAVFKPFLLENLVLESEYQLPVLQGEESIPSRMITFSKARIARDFDQWVCFYEDDFRFECFWNNPRKYLPMLSKFQGVISPDFTIFGDAPMPWKLWNYYRGRLLARWLQNNGVKVIPNVRTAGKDTFAMSIAGLKEHTVIAIGSHGLVKDEWYRDSLRSGVKYIVDYLQPSTILVYGPAPESVFHSAYEKGIKVIPFQTDTSRAHFKKAADKG